LLFMTGSPLQREGPFPLFQDAERGNGDSPKARAGGEVDAQNQGWIPSPTALPQFPGKPNGRMERRSSELQQECECMIGDIQHLGKA